MSLQARLRHSLGERWMELPPRGVDQPLVVGRAAGCDIQVPSVAVGQRHCVLFVHDGRWIVQAAGGAGGTFVNGVQVDGATFLSIGDAIRLGPDGAAPVLEIDPAGALAGGRGQPAVAPTFPVATPVEQPPAPAAAYGAYPQPYAPAPQPQREAVGGWPTEPAPNYLSSTRRKRVDSGNGVIIGMLLTLAIAAGTGYWLYRYQQNSARVVIRPAAPSPEEGAASTAPVQTRPAPAQRIRPPAPRIAATSPADTDPAMTAVPTQDPLPAPTDDPAPVDPVEPQSPTTATAPSPSDDPGWKQVLAARHLKDEGKAILLFDDYGRTHPDAPADQLREFTEAMFDRAWFERMAGLCDQREDLGRKIAELDKEIAEETDQNYKTRVATPLREKYVALLRGTEEELTATMKYAGKTVPNLLDDEELTRLRKTRDPQVYADWKSRILAHIRRTHGELPWVTNKSM